MLVGRILGSSFLSVHHSTMEAEKGQEEKKDLSCLLNGRVGG